MAFRQKYETVFSLGKIFSLIFLFQCSSLQSSSRAELEPPAPENISTLEFAAMGTVFVLKWENPQGSNFSPALATPLFAQLIEKYDSTFSDWQEESELRRLEKRGLSSSAPQKASPLFIEGLKWSQLAFDETRGLFDVSIGAVIWKSRARPVGLTSLEVFQEENSFRFGVDPVRLSFGGLAKGMLCGQLADVFLKNNVRSFFISAGGGNEAAAGSFLYDILTDLFKPADVTSGVLLLSHSRSAQGKSQHILDPRDPKKVLHQEIHLGCWVTNPSELRKIGALSDAFTTALAIEKFRIPQQYSCSQEISRKL